MTNVTQTATMVALRFRASRALSAAACAARVLAASPLEVTRPVHDVSLDPLVWTNGVPRANVAVLSVQEPFRIQYNDTTGSTYASLIAATKKISSSTIKAQMIGHTCQLSVWICTIDECEEVVDGAQRHIGHNGRVQGRQGDGVGLDAATDGHAPRLACGQGGRYVGLYDEIPGRG